jgi:hypothetical protein
MEDIFSDRISKTIGLKEATVPIEHSYVDFCSLILNQKIQAAFAKKSGMVQKTTKVEMNDYIISFFMEKIVQKCGIEVEEQDMIKNIIDGQFIDTQANYMQQLLAFIACFLVPFLVQIFTENIKTEIVCLFICLIVSLILFSEEVIKMKYTGIFYFFNIFCLNNLMKFLVFISYFVIKVFYIYTNDESL